MPAELKWPLLAAGSLFVFVLMVGAVLLVEPSLGDQVASFGGPFLSAAATHGVAALPASGTAGLTVPALVSGAVRCDAGATSGYQRCSFTDGRGETTQFLLHVPASYNPREKYPLVLVLHGGGERAKVGTATSEACALVESAPYVRVWVSGPVKVSDPLQKAEPNVQSRWPSFVVVPLLGGQNRWVDTPPAEGSHRADPSPTAQLEAARELVETVRRQYAGVDADRLYITGVSLGGYGTWDAIERWPGYFAAAVPVSGGGDPSRAAELKDLPIWVFHGASDHVVPVSGSRDMVEAIRAAGGQPRYTEYEGAGHDIWARVYSADQPIPGTGLFEWLFSQRRTG